MSFPISTLRIFAKISDDDNINTPLTLSRFLRGLVNGLEWIYIALVCGFILFYFGLLV